MLEEESKYPNPDKSDPRKAESKLPRQESLDPDGSGSRNIELRPQEEFLDSMDLNTEEGEKRGEGVSDATMEVSDGVSLDTIVSGGEERNGSNARASEVCSVLIRSRWPVGMSNRSFPKKERIRHQEEFLGSSINKKMEKVSFVEGEKKGELDSDANMEVSNDVSCEESNGSNAEVSEVCPFSDSIEVVRESNG